MNEVILTSTDNSFVKQAKELQERKIRRERNQFLIEGEKMFVEACYNHADILQVYILSGKQRNFTQFIDNIKCQLHIISEKVAKHLSTTQTVQPIFAVIRKPEFNKLQIGNKVLILDSLQDPGNMGTLLRSSAATDFTTVLMVNCVDIYNEKVIRSTMGGLFKCKTFNVEYSDIEELLSEHEILCADMKGENIFKFSATGNKIAVVVGNEGNGISKEILAMKHKKISLPMLNNVESLNAAVSGSLIMYELTFNRK